MAATKTSVALITLAMGLAVSACSGASDNSGRRDSSSASQAPTTMTVPTSVAKTPLECSAAEPADVAEIEATLTNGADHLGEAVMIDGGPYGYRLIAANLYDEAGTRISSSDVWVISGDLLFALSGGARDSSRLPDGRELGISAGNHDALQAIGCVQDG